MNLTSIFHLFSLLATMGLVFWLAREIKFSRNVKRLWRYTRQLPSNEPWVDWPDKFLQDFCRLLDAEYSFETSWKQPTRINPKQWIACDRSLQILGITSKMPGSIEVIVKNSSSQDEMLHWQQELSGAIRWKGIKVLIQSQVGS